MADDIIVPEIKLPQPRLGTIKERIDKLQAMEGAEPVQLMDDRLNHSLFVRYDKDGKFAGSIFQNQKGTYVTIGNETCSALGGQEIDSCIEQTPEAIRMKLKDGTIHEIPVLKPAPQLPQPQPPIKNYLHHPTNEC